MSPDPAAPMAFDKEMTEILESFLVESSEIIEKLGQDLLALEKNPGDADLHNVIFRAVHTLKGTSSFLGFEQLTTLAHRFEDVLNKLRRGALTIAPGTIDTMFEAYDLLKLLLQRIQDRSAEPVALDAIIGRLTALVSEEPLAAAPQSAPAAAPVPPPVADHAAEKAGGAEPAQPAPHEETQSQGGALVKSADSTIRVDVGRLDVLMNLVGELVLGRNRLAQIAGRLSEQQENQTSVRELAETSTHIDFITTELQMAVMKTRMVPVSKVFNKLPRLIRELSKETKKEMELVLNGEDTELDKTLIEKLNDPLIHLIRNAADHGIETPAERQALGKPACGTVTVTAEHEGNHIVICVSDDGKGMDPQVLKSKAVEKGMLTQAQADDLSPTEAFDLIFLPGFSTAKRVTNVSGRGVGMDVVRTNIRNLKGSVEIESVLNEGSTFRIRLPLTLAIIQALLVVVGGEVFSVPLESVLEVVRVEGKEIETIHGREVIRLRNTVLPLARLSGLLSAGRDGAKTAWQYIVVVGIAERRLGIVVDSLVGQREVVIKSLGEYLGTVKGIAGSTILGDGRVIMIIDVAELVRLSAAA